LCSEYPEVNGFGVFLEMKKAGTGVEIAHVGMNVEFVVR
jgi:hypothetical protein